MSSTRNKEKQDHFGRNLTLAIFGIIATAVLLSIYYMPEMIEANLEAKEWREGATCAELADYLVENVQEMDYDSYEEIEQIWKVKCQ